MKNPKKILIIIQRSNGDVLLSQTLISVLYEYYKSPKIDLLVNDDTLSVAQLLPNINFIHTFSYKKKRENRWKQEKDIIASVFRKYDLSINLTASDRSVLYALFASKNSISAIEKDNSKSWWKKSLLTHHYFFDTTKHILLNNLEPLNFLKIKHTNILGKPKVSEVTIARIKNKLDKKGIKDFVIFHPSAQYNYKIYPQHLRHELLAQLSSLDIGGPTNLRMWSPWSNQLQKSATEDMPIQNYGNITIFQANMPCVACGNAGCDNEHGKSECLDHISPQMVFNEVKNWYTNVRL